MKFTSSLLTGSAAILFAVSAAQAAEVDPVTTITPCPEATGLTFPPITVTSQYQEVYTCQPRTACVKHRCSTIFDLKPYTYVSTVVPCAWDGTTASTTTITRLDQPFRVSDHVETLTKTATTTVVPSETGGQWEVWQDWHTAHVRSKEAPKPTVTTTSLYETVTRRAVAPFEHVGPLAVPGWAGSGLCEECVNSTDGSRSQHLDVVECRFGVDQAGEAFHTCSEWPEVWVERFLPTSTAVAEAACVSQGSVPEAGTYTWTFPQSGQPVTVTAAPTTITTTLSGAAQKETVIVEPEAVYTLPGQPWNAYVTRTFPAPTNFAFNVFVTTTVTVSAPYITRPVESTRPIGVPSRPAPGPGRPDGFPFPPFIPGRGPFPPIVPSSPITSGVPLSSSTGTSTSPTSSAVTCSFSSMSTTSSSSTASSGSTTSPSSTVISSSTTVSSSTTTPSSTTVLSSTTSSSSTASSTVTVSSSSTSISSSTTGLSSTTVSSSIVSSTSTASSSSTSVSSSSTTVSSTTTTRASTSSVTSSVSTTTAPMTSSSTTLTQTSSTTTTSASASPTSVTCGNNQVISCCNTQTSTTDSNTGGLLGIGNLLSGLLGSSCSPLDLGILGAGVSVDDACGNNVAACCTGDSNGGLLDLECSTLNLL